MTPIADLSKALDLSTLKDTSVLITGGASGLGALTATSLRRMEPTHCSACVTIADINEKLAKDFVSALATKGLRLNYVPTEVTDWQSQVNAFKSAINFSTRKSLDFVIAAAGVAGQEFVAEDEEPPSLEKDPPLPRSADLAIDINAKGVYFTSKLAQHYFALPPSVGANATPECRKCLVVISSVAGYCELNDAAYTTSKWAVRGLFRSTRSKMEDLGYRVNLIAPWIMDTPLAKELVDLAREKGFPIGNANDVAKAVIRCAADDTICGRALAIGAAETFDLRDDLEGLNAGIKTKEYVDSEARGFLEFSGQRF